MWCGYGEGGADMSDIKAALDIFDNAKFSYSAWVRYADGKAELLDRSALFVGDKGREEFCAKS
jgi:hypothetical protein